MPATTNCFNGRRNHASSDRRQRRAGNLAFPGRPRNLMNKSRIVLQIFAALSSLLGMTLVLILVLLIYPADPGSSQFLNFGGFIVLPEGKSLNVLDYMVVSEDGLFIAGMTMGSVFKVALRPGKDVSQASVLELRGKPYTHGLALISGKNLGFVTRSEENLVDVFDTANLTHIGSIPVADGPDAILYDSATNLIYVSNAEANLATLIDPSTRAPVATVLLGGKPEFPVLDPRTGLLYQNLEDKDAVAVINLAQHSVVAEWSLAPCVGPKGLAIDSDRGRLFAACSNGMLVVFDLAGHRLIGSLPTGRAPDCVAFDISLHRIYVAGLSNKLTIIQQDTADSYRVLDNVRTHFAAHTIAIDPVSHRVYVGYASLFTRPRIAVFSPAG
jgi:YVTN family beta-propeller protein